MKHWQLGEDGAYATLTLDVAERSANVLSREVLQELSDTLADLATQPLKGLIIRSGKPNHFIVGADVNEFQTIRDAEQAAELARFGQHVFNRLDSLPFPSVAVIHGLCLGGGLELVLACDYRVALAENSTRLGLPEVRLGIHPGFAGTIRLPPLVGALAALDLMLTGRTVSVRAARRIGLVDAVEPKRHLIRAAAALIKKGHAKRHLSLMKRLPGWLPFRGLVRKSVLRKLRQRANPDHYPAPYRIIDLWRRHAGAEEEASSLGELLIGRTSRNLVHVFLLGEAHKRAGRRHDHRIRHVHIIGAGVMGGDIAAWSAYKGFTVSLQDIKQETLAKAMKRAHGLFKKRLKDPREIQQVMDRLMPDLRGDGVGRADLVIEAVVENADIKSKIFKAVEERAKLDAVLATNTSSIPLETLAKSLNDPSRLVGLHFFNPVAKMQLIEVVRGEQSSEDAINRANAFSVALDRLPLVVKSSHGFLVNRILMPYLIEAMKMVDEGIPVIQIDQAAKDFGMPMGPVLLADTVGLDICLSVAEVLSGPLGVPVPDGLRTMVEEGKLGKKTGQGFYKFDNKGNAHIPSAGKKSEAPITERLVLRQLNEAMACLREGVVADTDAVDTGMVYGTGFAPYLGGPMRYVESLGGTGIRHSLHRLSQEYGKRFNPDEGWSQPELLARHNPH